ncbi:hypothetical protein, partial [Bosea sp. (in: a-proteobacteria)]
LNTARGTSTAIPVPYGTTTVIPGHGEAMSPEPRTDALCREVGRSGDAFSIRAIGSGFRARALRPAPE